MEMLGHIKQLLRLTYTDLIRKDTMTLIHVSFHDKCRSILLFKKKYFVNFVKKKKKRHSYCIHGATTDLNKRI